MEDIKDSIVLPTRDPTSVFRLLTPEPLLVTVCARLLTLLAALQLS